MNGTKPDVQLNFLVISKKTDKLAFIIDTYIQIKYMRIHDRWKQENDRRFREGGMKASTFGLPDIELLSIISTKGTDGHKVNCANK